MKKDLREGSLHNQNETGIGALSISYFAGKFSKIGDIPLSALAFLNFIHYNVKERYGAEVFSYGFARSYSRRFFR